MPFCIAVKEIILEAEYYLCNGEVNHYAQDVVRGGDKWSCGNRRVYLILVEENWDNRSYYRGNDNNG